MTTQQQTLINRWNTVAAKWATSKKHSFRRTWYEHQMRKAAKQLKAASQQQRKEPVMENMEFMQWAI